VSLDEDIQPGEDAFPMEIADWAPNPEQLYWASELRLILINALSELELNLADSFCLARYRRAIDGSDGGHSELESHGGQGAAMAKSAAAS
jgi:hypothetical protein